jgi:DNA polymerase IV (DinB-like DNA polymerase)
MTDGSERGELTRWSDTDARETREDTPDRVVCHVDMDCFYASCERLRDPTLEDEPLVVGMGYEPGETAGAVATASYEARAVGVESAMPIRDALERLPRRQTADTNTLDSDVPTDESSDTDVTGYYEPVDMSYYQSVAEDTKAVLRDCADVVREVSIDEAYLDVTERTSWASAGADGDAPSTAAGPATRRTLAEGYARHIKERIEREAGVPASVGVAPNMSAAKVASDADKPDGLVVVPPGSVASFLALLPVSALHGVGPVTERALVARDIETAGDVAAADPETLTELLGDRGRTLYRRARGEDDRAVTPRGLPKSLSRESSLPATADDEPKRETVRALAADVAERAQHRGCLYRTIGIKVVCPPFDVNTRERSLPGPVDDPDLVEQVALELLTEFADDEARKLGVRVSNLDFADADQSTLTGFDSTETAIDAPTDTDPPPRLPTDAEPRETLTDWLADDTGTDESAHRDGENPPDGQASLGEWSSPT